MTRNKLTAITLSFMLVLSAFAFAGCSNKDNDEEKASKQVQTSDETALKEKAAKMNQEEENFYGTWVATSEKAEYLDHMLDDMGDAEIVSFIIIGHLKEDLNSEEIVLNVEEV